MPRFSGDGGFQIQPGTLSLSSIIIGDPVNLFAVLTDIQFKHFQQWKDGNFTTDEQYNDGANLDSFPPESQPEILTRAALELTIGNSINPGIEWYWIATDEKMYNFSQPFRIKYPDVKPGDLTRGLSIPWHSDFDLCNTDW